MSSALEHVPPNWFAAVMGTGIVAIAATTLPVQLPGQHAFAEVVWVLAASLLAGLTGLTAAHWFRHPDLAAAHHRDPVMAHFYGAPPMALLTVGTATLLLGPDLVGLRAAVAVDWTLWSLGTLLGLASAVAVPCLAFTRHRNGPDSAFGGWLMPVVPPMVSAAAGALLVPHTPPGQARLTMLMTCCALFGLSLVASLVVITLIWSRLARHDVGAPVMVPTLWIVLGPLGQSITAANLLGGVAHLALPAPYSTGLQALGVVFGVPVLGFALLWAAIATTLTVRAARRHLPFALTWWSFTFPIGTCVTGLSGLTARTGADAFRGLAALGFVVLLAAWAIVAVRTARGATTGELFIPPPPIGSRP